jgi:hypothetical protein
MMKRNIFALSLMVLACVANAENLNWTCFVSTDEAKPIHLAFAFVDGENTDAVVRYKKGSGHIVLKQKSVQEVEMAEGRPFERTYEYVEKMGGKEGGKYTIVVQGAIFYEFRYVSRSREKPYKFVVDTRLNGQLGCK